jgi:hypothetical protein
LFGLKQPPGTDLSASVVDIVINQMGFFVFKKDQVVTVKQLKLQNPAAPNRSVSKVVPISGKFAVKETAYGASQPKKNKQNQEIV